MASDREKATERGRLGRLLDDVRRIIRDDDAMRLGALLDGFGRTAFLPLLLLPALAVVTPLSGIPFFSTICGLTIALVSAQMIFRGTSLWLPSFLLDRHLPTARVRQALDRADPVADWIDRHSRDRLRLLVTEPMRTLAEVQCAIAGLMMPVLELVPFSSSVLGASVLLIAIGFLAHDGLYVLISLAFFFGGLALPAYILGG